MGTYYLIDFENVHNDGISNIENMTKEDHVHVFSTQNATNIRQDIFWLNGDIKSHLVPARKQSLDMHLNFGKKKVTLIFPVKKSCRERLRQRSKLQTR